MKWIKSAIIQQLFLFGAAIFSTSQGQLHVSWLYIIFCSLVCINIVFYITDERIIHCDRRMRINHPEWFVSMTNNIEFGNLEGKYFTQWRIDYLVGLLEEILARFSNKISNINIWYDAKRDYHHLKFNLLNKDVEIRYYKVISIEYDGKQSGILPSAIPSHQTLRILRDIEQNVSCKEKE